MFKPEFNWKYLSNYIKKKIFLRSPKNLQQLKALLFKELNSIDNESLFNLVYALKSKPGNQCEIDKNIILI